MELVKMGDPEWKWFLGKGVNHSLGMPRGVPTSQVSARQLLLACVSRLQEEKKLSESQWNKLAEEERRQVEEERKLSRERESLGVHTSKANAADAPTEEALRAGAEGGWYQRYVGCVMTTIETVQQHHPHAKVVRMLGIQGANHDTYGVRTRMEFTMLENDILEGQRKEAKDKIEVDLEWLRVCLDSLQEQLDLAKKKNGSLILIICSCPERIGNDTQIMEEVRKMQGGCTFVYRCWSQKDNATSLLFRRD